MERPIEPTIALFHWGNSLEDFLDTIDVSFESFCQDMTGGWLFGYIEALKLVGIRTVLFCISDRVSQPVERVHLPTGAKICVLPIPRIYRSMRRSIVNPYGWNLEQAVGEVGGWRSWQLDFYRHTLPYLATPLKLLAKELAKENCRAILCQEYEYARFDLCVILGRLTNIPVYATFQGGNFQLSAWEKYLRPLTIKSCRGLIIPSRVEIERVRQKYRIAEHKLAKIFNPLDVNTYHAIDRQQARQKLNLPWQNTIVVWHGRVEIFRKGLDILLDAWEIIQKSDRDNRITLLLIGTGSDAENLTRQIQQRKLTDIIWINKYILDRKTIFNYLAAADVYVLPSRHEGFPVAPLEAMSCGLPVVATDVPGIADILENGERSGGLIVPREDAIALADAAISIIQNRSLRQQLGKSARQRVENCFSLLAVGQQLKNFLAI